MIPRPVPLTRWQRAISLAASMLVSAAIPLSATAADTSPSQQLERFSQQAQAAGQVERGRIFFTTRPSTGEWSCSSCHGAPPTQPGKHASTGKAIEPLAPAVNPKAFTDTARVDKWFRRNCNDVLKRECTPAEKADVMAYLISLKP